MVEKTDCRPSAFQKPRYLEQVNHLMKLFSVLFLPRGQVPVSNVYTSAQFNLLIFIHMHAAKMIMRYSVGVFYKGFSLFLELNYWGF